jgi:hypothetical protein
MQHINVLSLTVNYKQFDMIYFVQKVIRADVVYSSVTPCTKPITLIFETIELVLSVLADPVSVASQNRNILDSTYSNVQVAAPCSNSFQSSAFRE